VTTAAITVAAGRHDHLQLQLAGFARSTRRPDVHVVVAMGDPEIAPHCGHGVTVVELPADPNSGLPVGRARNVGAAAALQSGADVLIFLDVDCVPSPTTVTEYETAVARHPGTLLSGIVRYLPPPPRADGYDLDRLGELGHAHDARPAPSAGCVIRLDYELFWSVSFALDRMTWLAIGGFDEGYTGYGGEDTDFAQHARARSVPCCALGGAVVYHQWHPAPEPPLQHLTDIVHNARRFRERWGWWPMRGWLTGFANLGLVHYDQNTDEWTLT
jgi:GT2 family glycosyltransferase